MEEVKREVDKGAVGEVRREGEGRDTQKIYHYCAERCEISSAEQSVTLVR